MTTPTTPSYSDDEFSGEIYPDLLPEDPPDVGYVGFQNSVHAMALGINVEWFPRGPDATIPMTDEEEQRVAWKLLCSLKDMSIAWESAEDADRKCLTPGEAMYYGEATLQHCVWQLLVSQRLSSHFVRILIKSCSLDASASTFMDIQPPSTTKTPLTLFAKPGIGPSSIVLIGSVLYLG